MPQVQLADSVDAKVVLQTDNNRLHVIETVDLPKDEALTDFHAPLEKRAEPELANMVKQFDDSRIKVDKDIRFGHPPVGRNRPLSPINAVST